MAENNDLYKAYSILGAGTTAEYNRRRKEEEEYRKRARRDQYIGYFAAPLLKGAGEAVAGGVTGFVGDLIMGGPEKEFFTQTEDGLRIASAASRANKAYKTAEEARKEWLKSSGGNHLQWKQDQLLKEKMERGKSVYGDKDGNEMLLKNLVYSKESKAEALEFAKQEWDELTSFLDKYKNSPSLTTLKAARDSTVLGKGRARQVGSKLWAKFRGKDYESEVVKPAVQEILNRGVPGRSQDWYDVNSKELERELLAAINTSQGLDNFITKLEESEPEATGELRANFDRATEQMVLANMYSSEPKALLNKGYTQGQIDAIQRGNGLVDGNVPSPSAADQMIRKQIAENLKGVIPSWGNTQLKERIGTFRSFGGATAERIDEVNEQLYQRYYADSGKEIPSNIATFEQARAKQLDDQKEIPALMFVQDRMDSLLLGSANLAQSLVVEDMSVNQNSYYFNGNPAASQLKVEKEFYQRLNLILGSGLETENVNFLLEDNRVFDDVRVNRNILTGKLKQSKDDEQVRLINESIVEQNTEGALPTGSSDALITDLAPPTLTTLNRQIKDMDGTGVLSAKGAAVRGVVSLFDAEYDKNLSKLSQSLEN